jgi:hypothetical protein
MSKREEVKLTVHPDRSKILMNDSLKEVFGDNDPFPEKEEVQFIIVALDRFINGIRSEPIMGTLVSFLLDKSPEIEIMLSITDGMECIRAMGSVNQINEVQLHHGENLVSLEGPYEIEAMRMQDINPVSQTCVLSMKLTHQHT